MYWVFSLCAGPHVWKDPLLEFGFFTPPVPSGDLIVFDIVTLKVFLILLNSTFGSHFKPSLKYASGS